MQDHVGKLLIEYKKTNPIHWTICKCDRDTSPKQENEEGSGRPERKDKLVINLQFDAYVLICFFSLLHRMTKHATTAC